MCSIKYCVYLLLFIISMHLILNHSYTPILLYTHTLYTHINIQLYCSPEGTKIAIQGVGGYTHLLEGSSKLHITDLKMNSPLRSFAFLNESMCVTSGLDADVYIW